LLDTADTFSGLGSDSDVSTLSPGGSPRVSDDVEVLSILRSITDSSHGMIKVGSAFLRVEDTTSVHLENKLVSLDGDGSGSLSNGSLELVNGLLLDVVNLGHEHLTLGSGGLALSVLGGVWVVGLELLLVVLHVVHGVLLETAIATLRLGVAVDHLLLGEGQKLVGSHVVSALDGSSGGESPAGTALALVLDSVDGTSLSPVDGLWDVLSVEDGDVLGSLNEVMLRSLVSQESLVLVMSPVRELVVTKIE